MDEIIGIIKNERDSIEEIRELRNKLSKEKFNLEEINIFDCFPKPINPQKSPPRKP